MSPARSDDQRKRYLETLHDRMSAPADVMRQHMRHQSQNATLGLAAEVGVRELLRLVLPKRFAVTSGFVRTPGRSLREENPSGTISAQTDVIVYDALRSVPLHAAGDIELIAAPDVLGLLEVKDTAAGSEDLGPGEGRALPHVATLATHAPFAFRGVVLFRGKVSTSTPEIEIARARLADSALEDYAVPHVIYCASYRAGDQENSYVAFYDYRAQAVRFHEYQGDPTSALASFLRVFTGRRVLDLEEAKHVRGIHHDLHRHVAGALADGRPWHQRLPPPSPRQGAGEVLDDDEEPGGCA